MSQRTVAVVLRAQVDDYLRNMTAAERRTLEVERGLRTATQQFQKHNEALGAAGRGFLIGGAAVAAGIGLAIRASAEYGAKMAQLQALSKASQGEMARMSDAAMTQGKAFGFSAGQVADAEIELTKAGRSAANILGGDLKGALALAAAGQMDVAKATEIGVTAVTQFAATGATIPHVADLLAAGADKALGSVEDLGMALNQSGLVAAQFGLTADQTVGTLTAFANAGLLGSDAGTSFKTMLTQLAHPSQQAQALLDKYRITINDSSGSFVGITNLAGQLHHRLGDLQDGERNAALATIFGNDAIRAANVLYNESSTGLQHTIDSVNAYGFANAQAAGKLNSLAGDSQKFAAQVQTDLIKAGQAADGPLRGIVQSATGAAEAIGSMPPEMQTAVMVAGTLAAGVGLLGGAFLLGVPRAAAFRQGLTELNLTGRQAAGIFGKGSAILLGVTSLVSGFAALAEHGVASDAQIKKNAESIKSGWADLDKQFGSAGTSVFSGSGVKNALRELTPENGGADAAKFFDGITLGITHFSDVYKANEGNFDAMGQQLAGLAEQDYSRAASSFSTLVDRFHLGAREQAQLLEEMPAYRDQLAHMATQAGVSTDKQSLLNYAQLKGSAALKLLAVSNENAAAGGEANAAAVKVLAGNADEATTSVDDLVNAIKGLDHGQLSARAAARAMQKAIDDAADSAKKNGRTLDTTTEKGRNNQAALDAIASSAEDSAAAYEKAGGSAKGAQRIIDDGKKAFTDAARAMGMSENAAKRLAEKLLGIPGTVNPYVSLSGAEDALAKAANLKSYIEWLKKQGVVNVAVHADEAVNLRLGRATGGPIPGMDRGVDTVPILARPGEHMWTVDETRAVGGHTAMHRLRAAALAGDLNGYAVGGEIGGAQKTVAIRERDARRAAAAYQHASKGTRSDREQDMRDAEQRLQDARAHLQTLLQEREDFVSAERRSPDRRTSDPLAYVDQLRQMSRSDDFSRNRRDGFDAAANRYERSLVKLADRSEKAAQKVDDLRQASAQMHDSVKQAIAGGYTLAGAATPTSQNVASGWTVRDGIRFQSYQQVQSGPSAASVAAYYRAGAGTARQFASALKQLAGRKVNPALLAELAQMGTEAGLPIAEALLSGSSADLASINASYRAIQTAAGRAGTTVADDNYAKQIAAADRNADKIADQIKTDGEKLRKLIASAFGLKGYASGTDFATPGVHLVGEQGPELVGMAGGEWVANAQDTARWIRGGGSSGGGGGTVVRVEMPESLALQDADGVLLGSFRTVARGVATQVVDARHSAIAVRLMGASR